MGFDDIKNRVSKVTGDEEKTDAALDKAAHAIDERTGGKHADKIDQARDFLDSKLGDER